MTRHALLASLVAFALAAPAATMSAHAAPLRVTLELRGAPSEAATPVTVVAQRVDGDAAGASEPLRAASTTIPTALELPARLGAIYQVSIAGEGLWSPPALVRIEGEPTELTLPVWRTAPVRGRLALPRGATLEQRPRLLVRFTGSEGVAPERRVPEGRTECPIVDGGFSCDLPEGVLDFALRTRGFASHRFWDRTLVAGRPHGVGTLTLVPGGSLAGEVAGEPIAVDPAEVELLLEPRLDPVAPPAERARQAKLAHHARADPRGFFVFEGLAAGAYVLTARHPRLAPSEVSPVTIYAGSETLLGEPVLLRPPIDLPVVVEPPRDPSGHAWRVTLERNMGGNALEEVGVVSGDEEGISRFRNLRPGRYVVSIADAGGARLAFEELDVPTATGEFRVSIALVEVVGAVRFGDDPLAGAKIVFGGEHGVVRVEVRSDDRGRYRAALPRAGRWTVAVDADEPPLAWEKRGLEVREPRGGKPVRLDLEIPGTELRGRVVDLDRQAVAGALVTLRGATFESVEASDEEGEFRFLGVPEETHAVRAATRDAESAEIWVSVTEEGPESEVELVLEPRRVLSGQLLAPTGPVPGALVSALPLTAGVPGILPVQARTDVAGNFELKVPAGSDELLVLAYPQGFALLVTRVRIEPEQPLVLFAETGGGTLDLTLDAPLASREETAGLPQLVLVDRHALPLRLATLYSWIQLSGERVVAGLERLRVPRMPAGDYRLCWAPPGGITTPPAGAFDGRHCAHGFLADGALVELAAQAPE